MKNDKLVKVIDDSGCFVCGADNPLGLKVELSVDKEKNSSYCTVVLLDHFQGWKGVVHGGILATLLDESCAYACLTATDQCVTAEIKVRYRKPVPVDREIEIFGQLIDKSHKVWLAKSQIKIEGVVYAEAEAKMYNLAKD